MNINLNAIWLVSTWTFYLVVYSSPEGGGIIVFTHVNIEVGKLLGAPWGFAALLKRTLAVVTEASTPQVFPPHYHTDRATAAPRWPRMGFGSVTLAP